MLVRHRWRCERKPVLKVLPRRKVPLLAAHWGGRFAERDKGAPSDLRTSLSAFLY